MMGLALGLGGFLVPGSPFGGQGLDFIGVLAGEVMEFSAVGVEVIEFPTGLVTGLGDEFPVLMADGATFGPLPEDGGGAVEWFSVEGGQEADALEWGECLRRGRFGVGGAGYFDEGGHDIDEVAGGVIDCVGLDVVGPPGDQRGLDASLEAEVFVFAVGGIGDIGPVTELGGPSADRADFAGADFHGFATGSVIAGKEDKSILEALDGLEFLEEAADVLVEAVDHGGVDLHALDFGGAGVRWERVPVGRFLRAEGSGGGIEESELDLLLVALFTDLLVAGVVGCRVFGDVVRPGHEWVVGCGVGEVEEEGFLVLV